LISVIHATRTRFQTNFHKGQVIVSPWHV